MKVPGILIDAREAFDKYILTGDKELIEHFTLDQLNQASAFIGKTDEDMPYAKAIISRIGELNDIKTQKRASKEKWVDRLAGFILGIITAFAVQFIQK